jgi:hypothetical protein
MPLTAYTLMHVRTVSAKGSLNFGTDGEGERGREAPRRELGLTGARLPKDNRRFGSEVAELLARNRGF